MDNSVIKFSDLIGSDETFDEIFSNIRTLKKELKDLGNIAKNNISLINPNDEKAIEAAIKDVSKLTEAKKRLDEEEKTAIKTKNKLNKLNQEELILREKQKIENRERVQKAKQLAILRKEEKGSIASLRAELSLITLEWKKLSKEERENSKIGKNLVKDKKRLTEQLKRLEKQTGDTRRNVGNYTDSLGMLGRTAARIFIGRSIIDGIKKISSALIDITNDGAGFSKQLAEIQKTGNRFVNILTGAGAKLLERFAPAINKIINLFSFVLEKISQTSKETGFLGDSFRFVGKVIDGVVNLFFDLPAIFGGIVSASKQLASNIGDSFSKLGLQLRILFANIEKVNPFSDRSKVEIERNIAALRRQITTINDEQVGVVNAFKNGFDAVKKEQEEFEKNQGKLEKLGEKIRNTEKEKTEELENQNKLISEQNDLYNSRIKAIESLQKKLLQLEAGNLKDRQEQAFRFEELRFKEEQKQREENFDKFIKLVEKQEKLLIQQFGKNSQKVIEFRKKAAEEIRAVEELNLKIEQEQIKKSEQNKLNIRKEFAIKTKDIESISVVDDSQKEFNKKLKEELEEKQKLIEQDQALSLKNQREATEQLLSDISKTSKTISTKIVELFEKQAELAGKLVDDQAEAIENQRQRAEQGFDNTLKFEQEQLSKREANQIRAEQRAKQAAKILALFNLVSAYAANGDENALTRGLVDFSLLQAFETGFKEGGYTGNSATDSVVGHVHGQEYVVTAEDTVKYGLKGKKGNEFGEVISDYFKQGSPLLNNHFGSQRTDFENGIQVFNNTFDISGLQSELKQMRQSFERMPRQEFDVLWITDYVIELTKKTVRNNMTKVEKARRKL